MNNHHPYRKLIALKNGEKVLIRFLNEHDRESLIRLFQEAQNEDVEFCKEDLKNPQTVDYWLTSENSGRIMCLVALELETNQPIAALTLQKGQQAALKVGEIQNIFVSRTFQGLGLGSLILDALLDLALQKNFHWLRVEVPIEQKYAIKALLARDFEIKATLDDFFISKKGVPHDVALMIRPLIRKTEEDF
jgi:L-amino acid N-acyltransferase YncA